MTILAVALLALVAPSQDESAPPRRFPASVALAGLDVVAVDGDGRPVTDLRPEEFVLRLDGEVRPVASARFRSHPSATVPDEEEHVGFSTNARTTADRIVTIVVDQDSIPAGAAQALGGLAERLVEALGPMDQVAVLTLPGPSVRVRPTRNRELVRAGIGQLVGRRGAQPFNLDLGDAMAFSPAGGVAWSQVTARLCPPSHAPDWEEQVRRCVAELESEARIVTQAFRTEGEAVVGGLRRLVESLGKTPGTKPLVFVSGGFAASGSSDLDRLADEATAAGVRLHVVLLGDSAQDATHGRLSRRPGDEQRLRAEGPQRLAGVTGGSFHEAVGSSQGSFSRLVGELSGEYAVGFVPEPRDMDGRAHTVAVEVTRPGVTVRAPRSLTLRPASRTPEEILSAALQSRWLGTDLEMKVATFALRAEDPDRIRVLMSTEIGRDETSRPPETLELVYALADEAGRVVASGHRSLDAVPVSGPTFVGEASVPGGRYLLKLAALDGEGRLGSVRHPVRATLAERNGLLASDLILAAASDDGRSAPRPGVDVAIAGGALAAYVEIYAADEAHLADATVEVEIGVPGEGGTLLSAPAAIRLTTRGRRAYQGRVDLGALPPGTYEARAVVSVDSRPEHHLTRPFRVARSRGGAGASGGLGDAATLVRFDPASVLRLDFAGPALDEIHARSGDPAAPAARQHLATGSFDSLVDVAAGARDPLAGAFLRGLAAYARAEYPKAAEHFREALRVGGNVPHAAAYLGACHAASGRDKDAVGAWQTALMTRGDDPVLERLVGEALLRAGDAEAALEHARAARETWPDEAALWRAEALSLMAVGRLGEATSELQAYVGAHPDDLDVLYLTARLLFERFLANGDPAARDDLLGYARSYVDANGPHRLLVGRWIRHVETSRE